MSTEQPTRRARKACAEWLADCLKDGWRKDSIDGLEALWWEHHDHTGKLVPHAKSEGQPASDGAEAPRPDDKERKAQP
jgi:hypothetical protein